MINTQTNNEMDRLFKIGTMIEFNNDGDICKVDGLRFMHLCTSVKSGVTYVHPKSEIEEMYKSGKVTIR